MRKIKRAITLKGRYVWESSFEMYPEFIFIKTYVHENFK